MKIWRPETAEDYANAAEILLLRRAIRRLKKKKPKLEESGDPGDFKGEPLLQKPVKVRSTI